MPILLSHAIIGLATLAVLATLTYKIASRHGITVGVLAWVLQLAFFKFAILEVEGPLWSIKIFGMFAGLMGWLLAWHFKLNPDVEDV